MKLRKHIDYWGLVAVIGFLVVIFGLQITANRNNTPTQQNIRGVALSVAIILLVITVVRFISHRGKTK